MLRNHDTGIHIVSEAFKVARIQKSILEEIHYLL